MSLQAPNRLQLNFFYVFLFVISVTCVLIFLPYVSALFLALVLSVIFNPLYLRIRKLTLGTNSLASFLTVCVVSVLILVPLGFLAYFLFQEVKAVYGYFTDGGGSVVWADYLGRMQGWLGTILPDNLVPETTIGDLENYLNNFYQWIGDHFQTIFNNAVSVAGNLFVFILALYFFFRDGDKFRKMILKLSPLNDKHDETILKRMAVSVESVVKGSLLVAVLQGLLTSLGFWMFGVPSPVLWGMVTVLVSLVPGVGTAITIIPAALFVALTDAMLPAVGLLAWGVLIVGTMDNFLRPFIIERGIPIHPFLILLSVFGGLGLFGAIGFLVGPIILSLLFVLMEIYSDVVSPKAN